MSVNKRKLLSILGRGQHVLNERVCYYKTAFYFFEDKEPVIETPFVGEAIARIHHENFDEVHILGTKDSMWAVLYAHCTGEGDIDYIPAEELDEFKQKHSNYLEVTAQAFSKLVNLPVLATEIPLGNEKDADKQMKAILQNILREGDEVTFDFTHGLRPQSYLIQRELWKLNSQKQIHFREAYYGALELTGQYDGLTPILTIPEA